MPRRDLIELNFRQEEVAATLDDVLAAVNTAKDEIVSEVEGNELTTRRILVGHEAHLWDAEVTAVDAEEG